MDSPEPKQTNTISWITSLAITVTCCAVQFVLFAGFIFDLKESIGILRIRSDLMNERIKETDVELENLRHHALVQQIQILPPPNGAAVQLPLSLTPPGQEQPVGTSAPIGAAAPVGTAAPMTPVGTSVTSPVTIPTVAPEPPPTKHEDKP